MTPQPMSLLQLLKIYRKNKKIKIFKNSENKGLAYSMNKIIKKSKGEYLAFLILMILVLVQG